ncbi:MAG TPA: phosphate regulon sensor histidine kinase PhoR [Solimonas sp.]|nr:phosphate regulon sensor histidine kinase PhoR [Solimonas sp.]
MDPAPAQDAPAAPAPVPDAQRALAGWREELLRLGLIVAAGGLVGWMFGFPLEALCLVLWLCLALQLRNLAALRRWLQHPKHFDLPEPGGLWGEIFDRLLELQRKNRKKKKKLSALLAEFQASTAALPDGAVVLGERGEIGWFNQAAQAMLGLRAPQDVGLRVSNLIRHPAFTEFFEAGRFEKEVEAPSPINRARTLSLRLIPYGNNQKLLIVRDVSELRRLETARRDFVANASHELRTPLTVLRGYLDMMEAEAQGRSGPLAGWRAPLTEMRNQATRMEALVADMLKIARLESDGTPLREELLDVPRLIRRALDEARALSAGAHRFESQLQPDLGLTGGETELLSMFGNLLTNAVRYTPAGGAIRVSWSSESEGARFAVADTGIGIADKDIPRLTERFYRVDVGRSRASGGTGLGLAIVKHAVERHDARMQVESEVGVGSTFTCHFPLHRVVMLPQAVEQGVA